MNQAISETYIRERLTEARRLEFCIDFDKARTVLSPLLNNLIENQKQNPLHTRTELDCEILLVYGSVNSYKGHTTREKQLQATAMDFLTEARELAIELDNRALIAEAEKQIGLCYFRLGQHDNASVYFDSVLERFSPEEQLTDRICLATQSNLIGLNFELKKTDAAGRLVEKIEPFVAQSDDLWLQTMFYSQAASYYLSSGNFRLSIPFLERAILLSTKTGNEPFLANALNNLALVYFTSGEISRARTKVKQAIEIFNRLGQSFSMAMALETKAQILIAEEKLSAASKAIEESITILEKSENYLPLTESLWTRIVITARRGEKLRAIKQFRELIRIAEWHLSEGILESFLQKFADLIYLRFSGTFYEKSEDYRRHLIDEALRLGGGVTQTADILGISHQNTSLLLKKYPDLCEKHNVRLRHRSTDSFSKKKT